MKFPTIVKLIGYITVFGRFMSRSADKGLPFFKVLKKRRALVGTRRLNSEQAFQSLKKCLEDFLRWSSLP